MRDAASASADPAAASESSLESLDAESSRALDRTLDDFFAESSEN